MKKLLPFLILFLLLIPSVISYAQPSETISAGEAQAPGDMIEEESSSEHEEENYGKLIITAVPVPHTNIILNFSRDNGDSFDAELSGEKKTEVLLPEGNYHLNAVPVIIYDENYDHLNSLPLTYFAKTDDNPGGTFTITAEEETYLGSEDNPVYIKYTYSENLLTDGEIKDVLIDPDLLSIDPRFEKKYSVKDTQDYIQKEADAGIDESYEDEMSAYIKEICEEEGIEAPDDSRIQSYGGYGEHPYGTEENTEADEEIITLPEQTIETLTEKEAEVRADEVSAETSPADEIASDPGTGTYFLLIAVTVLSILLIIIVVVIFIKDVPRTPESRRGKKIIILIILCAAAVLALFITINKYINLRSVTAEQSEAVENTQAQTAAVTESRDSDAQDKNEETEETYYNRYENSAKYTDRIKSVTISSGKGTRGRLVDLAVKSNGHITYNTGDTAETYGEGFYTKVNGRYCNSETGEIRKDEPEGMSDQGYVRWLFRNTFGNTPDGFDSLPELYKNGRQVSSEDLEIGDIGMTYDEERDDNRYGVFIGYSDSLPVFTYLSPVGDDSMPAGRNYIATLKSAGETVIDGAYPVDLNYFVRPDVKWVGESE